MWIVRTAILFQLTLCSTVAFSQTQPSTWGQEYSFGSDSSRSVRMQHFDLQRKLDGGFYDSFGPDTNTVTNNYDHSVGDLTISGSDGDISITNNTEDGGGTVTNSVGSINTSTNDISISGSGNILDVGSESSNSACVSGDISTISNNQSLTNAPGNPSC